jgi:hypothetical protein
MRHVAMQRLRTDLPDGGKQVRLMHDAGAMMMRCDDIFILILIFLC